MTTLRHWIGQAGALPGHARLSDGGHETDRLGELGEREQQIADALALAAQQLAKPHEDAIVSVIASHDGLISRVEIRLMSQPPAGVQSSEPQATTEGSDGGSSAGGNGAAEQRSAAR
jgi:hypothetical protein